MKALNDHAFEIIKKLKAQDQSYEKIADHLFKIGYGTSNGKAFVISFLAKFMRKRGFNIRPAKNEIKPHRGILPASFRQGDSITDLIVDIASHPTISKDQKRRVIEVLIK